MSLCANLVPRISPFFFFDDTATTEIYTLSLHDALPIFRRTTAFSRMMSGSFGTVITATPSLLRRDRKSTRLNSSHTVISYAVFCLKKKNNKPSVWIAIYIYRDGNFFFIHRIYKLHAKLS